MVDLVSSDILNDGAIRQAVATDVLCLHALSTQVFLETYATSGIREAIAREVGSQLSAFAWAGRLARPEVEVLVVEHHRHLRAFAEIEHGATHALVSDDRAAELCRLYVQSPFVRRSLGSALLRAAEATAHRSGARTLWLTAWVNNRRALAFYASQGYEELGVTDYTFENEHYENRLFAKKLRGETA